MTQSPDSVTRNLESSSRKKKALHFRSLGWVAGWIGGQRSGRMKFAPAPGRWELFLDSENKMIRYILRMSDFRKLYHILRAEVVEP